MLHFPAQGPSLCLPSIAEQSHKRTADAGPWIRLIAHALPERIEVGSGLEGGGGGAAAAAAAAVVGV